MKNDPNDFSNGPQEDQANDCNKNIADPAASEKSAPESFSPNTDEAIAFLLAWHPKAPWLLSAIPPNRKGIETCEFNSSSVEHARRWIDSHQGRCNLYFSPNEAPRGLGKKTLKEQITRAVCYHVDVDPREAEDVQTEQMRIRSLFENFSPRPTLLLFSGGGCQAFWRLCEPVDLNGNAESIGEIERINIALEVELEGDNCHNVDRIMRLPGTINVPDAKKLKKGRKAALAAVVWFQPEVTFDANDFEALAAKHRIQREAQSRATSTRVESGQIERVVVNIDELTIHEYTRSLIRTGAADGRTYKSRSEAVCAVACELVRQGHSDSQIASILCDPANAISGHIRDRKGNPWKYAIRQAVRAREFVGADFAKNENGIPYKDHTGNIRLALCKMCVELSFNEFTGRFEIEGLPGFGPALDDGAIERLWIGMRDSFSVVTSRPFFEAVARDQARAQRYHPVTDFLDGLEWDGIPRLALWLHAYGQTDDSDYTRAVSQAMLVAAVRRVRKPGVKFDEMVVLEGTQGVGKSSALKILAMQDEWFTDVLPLDGDPKRVMEAIEGKWIVEASELSGLGKAEVEHFKAFLSRTHDRARRPYERFAIDVARQCIMVGTTNSESYLRDTTGNRRFLPVRVNGFDLSALKRDREQLWAEAAMLEATGIPLGVPPELWPVAAVAQEARILEDPLFEMLADRLGFDCPGKVAAEKLWELLNRQRIERSQANNRRLGDAMRRLGFQRTRLRFGGRPVYAYIRGDEANPCDLMLANLEPNTDLPF